MLSICFNSSIKSWHIGKHGERITKIKLFVNKYKWEGINFPSEKGNWKKVEKNNVRIALNLLYVKKEKIYPTYVSKNNLNCKKQVILLMILNEEKCGAKSEGHKWSETVATWDWNFYCLNCLHFYRKKNKLELRKKVCANKDFCKVIMPSEDTEILEFK